MVGKVGPSRIVRTGLNSKHVKFDVQHEICLILPVASILLCWSVGMLVLWFASPEFSVGHFEIIYA